CEGLLHFFHRDGLVLRRRLHRHRFAPVRVVDLLGAAGHVHHLAAHEVVITDVHAEVASKKLSSVRAPPLFSSPPPGASSSAPSASSASSASLASSAPVSSLTSAAWFSSFPESAEVSDPEHAAAPSPRATTRAEIRKVFLELLSMGSTLFFLCLQSP